MGYSNFLMRKKIKSFFYGVGEFLTLLWIFFVFYILMIMVNI